MSEYNIVTPNISEFIISSQKKKPLILLSELKAVLIETINLLGDSYANSSETLINKCEKSIKEYYYKFMQIKFFLSILIIKDKSQTNKYEYEKCFELSIFMNVSQTDDFLAKMYEYIAFENDFNKFSILNLSKINKNDPTCKISFDTYNQKTKEHAKTELTSKFNNLLNHILINIVTLNEIISPIYITEY
jgi:hypothetical protein